MNVWQKPYANNIGTRQVNSGPVVGIDFGTSNSCVSIWNPLRNNAKLIKCDGKKIIQSTLQFYKNNFNEVLVGSSSPDSNAPIVSYIKSYLMDEDYENQKILCVNNANETKSMTAAELITLVLRRLKLYAENYLNDKKHMKIRQAILSMHETKSGCMRSEKYLSVSRAVIGIPANFSSGQQNALTRAAKNAGFIEVHLMVESTAAALSYGLHVAGRKTVMVFDMGGGTTDITIMLINDGRTELLGVHGDNSCGGRDLDYQLLDHVLTRLYTMMNLSSFAIEYQKLKDEFFKKSKSLNQLLESCRLCKETLTDNSKCNIEISQEVIDSILQIDNSLNQPVFPTITLTIEEFGEICKNTLLKVERVVENTIKIYRNTIQSRQSIGIENYEDSIDEVVLVGGSSKVPFVRLRVSKALYDAGYHKFHGHLERIENCINCLSNNRVGIESDHGSATFAYDFCSALDPELAVASGLAVRGAIIMDFSVEALKDILMLDILPYSIGLMTWTDNPQGDSSLVSSRCFEAILQKGSKLPCESSMIFPVLNPAKQKFVSLDIYEEVDLDDEEDEGNADIVNTEEVSMEQLLSDYEFIHHSSTSPSDQTGIAFDEKVDLTQSKTSDHERMDKTGEMDVSYLNVLPHMECGRDESAGNILKGMKSDQSKQMRKYNLIATYDFPIPVLHDFRKANMSVMDVNSKIVMLDYLLVLVSENTVTKINNVLVGLSDWIWCRGGFILDYFYDNVKRPTKVKVKMEMNEHGILTFSVEAVDDVVANNHIDDRDQYNEKNSTIDKSDVANTRKATPDASNTNLLLFYVVIMLMLYSFIKLNIVPQVQQDS